MIDRLRNTSPQLLLILTLLFMGVGFSLYKAIESFSAKQDSPEYQRSPGAEISPPVPDTLFDFSSADRGEVLRIDQQGFRFPDNALLTAGDGTQTVIDSILDKELTGDVFRGLGYGRRDADSLAEEIQSSYNKLIRFGSDEKPKVAINSVEDVSPASLALTTQAIFVFYESAGQRALQFTWLPTKDETKWQLQAIGNGFP